MGRRRTLTLTAAQRTALLALRDHHPKPYLRERAAALLKLSEGWAVQDVARHGLLRPYDPETVSAWLDRYQAGGPASLTIRPGRGRKPAFSPDRSHGRSSDR